MLSGFIAFIADTIGIGSFAVNIAFAKFFNTFSDEQLPGLTNGAQVIPGAIEAIFFLSWIDVKLITLVVFITGTCLGGIIGAYTIAHVSKQTIRALMIVAFTAMLAILMCYILQQIDLTGDLTSFTFTKLVIGFFAMLICGALTSVGVGLFVSVQAVLFLMNISPLLAFPIMTASGAIQQPLTTLTLLANDKIQLKKTLYVSFAGIVGSSITLPLFTKISVTWLHYLLMLIVGYNLSNLWRDYWQAKKQQRVLSLAQTR